MPKQAKPLTVKSLSSLKPQPGKQIERADGQVKGLRVRMNPSGVLTWSLHVHASDGRRRRFDVGAGLDLVEARARAESLRQAIRGGSDPTATRRSKRERARAAEKGEGTLKALVENYFTSGSGRILASKGEQERRIKDVFSDLLKIPAIEITLPQLQIIADKHLSPSSAARAVAYLKPILKWAATRELVQKDLRDLEKPAEHSDNGGQGQRVLKPEELEKILPCLGNDGYGLAARFMLLTGCRRGEADGATWGEINFDDNTWTIAPARRKDTRSRIRKKQVVALPHVIPLSPQALAILKSMNKGKAEDLIFKNKRGGQLLNWQKWQVRMMKRSGVIGWDRHSLRRTCATLAGELGAEPHVISALLGHRHIGSQLTSIYNKARYQTEHREALETVGKEIDKICEPKANQPVIIPFNSAELNNA